MICVKKEKINYSDFFVTVVFVSIGRPSFLSVVLSKFIILILSLPAFLLHIEPSEKYITNIRERETEHTNTTQDPTKPFYTLRPIKKYVTSLNKKLET